MQTFAVSIKALMMFLIGTLKLYHPIKNGVKVSH
jgi:hypothetical protein